MADSLPTLIKLAAYRVEQAQQVLAAAQRAQDMAAQNLATWQAAGTQGYNTALAQSDITQLANAGHYLQKARDEEAKAKQTLAARTQETNAARKVLTEAFSTQKRYELLHQKHQLQARKTLQKKQQNALEDTTSQKRP